MKKGDLIYWEVSDMSVDPTVLADLGFEAYVPRNDYKSAMIKALRIVTKGNDKLYRKKEDAHFVVFAVFSQVSTSNDISINKEFAFKVNKKTGEVTSDDPDFSGFYFDSGLKSAYDSSKATLNSEQIRSMLSKSIKKDFYAVSLKSHGGVYFVDQSKTDAAQEKFRTLFNAFPEQMRLRIMAIHDDKNSVEAVEGAVADEVFSEIEALISGIDKDFKEGVITRKKLENDKAEAEKILEKIQVHANNLSSKLKSIKDKIGTVSTALAKVTADVESGIVEPEDFMKMLREIE